MLFLLIKPIPENRLWIFEGSDASFCSGVSLVIYTTSTEENIAYILEKAHAVVCVVDTEERLFQVP